MRSLSNYKSLASSVQEYEGPREAAGIVNYLKRMTGPASRKLESVADVASHVDAKDFAIVGVFPGGEKSAEFKAFSKAADRLRSEHELVHVVKAEHMSGGHCDQGACKGAQVFVLKKYDEPKHALAVTGKTTVEAIEEFVESSITPKVIELSQEARYKKALSKIFEDQDTPKLLVFGDKADAEGYEALREAILSAQDQFPGQFGFLLADSANQGAMNYFGLQASDLPVFAIHRLKPSDAKFIKKNGDAKEMNEWIQQWKDGKVERYMKSEPEPATNDDPVKVIVGTTFDELVFNSGKDVLLGKHRAGQTQRPDLPPTLTDTSSLLPTEFYAPWCGHCKKLAPIYDAVGERFKDDETVMIAKVDATANDFATDKFEVKGFPTLYLYQAKTGKVIAYNGDRTEDSLVEFVNKNRSAGAKAAKEEEKKEEEKEEAEHHEEL